ncbi:MAG TPA: family 1 glycosylhydrolase [Candidatus Saccharimonadales bacterium]|nr:family 1 glycosylhydrolase [Candidatus Saccharimonadales bacterium]
MSYPKDFLWGASTSSHQVEGNTHNQWSVWEQERAQHLASTAQKRLGELPNWHAIATQATDPQNYISGASVDHFNRYADDLDLLQQLHMNAYRFGIEWSRIEPKPGVWDAAAIDHYRQVLSALKKRGITPVLTLWHWTMPEWFTKKGGFEHGANLHYFDQYVRKILAEFGNDLHYVITLNEPTVYAGLSYQTGEWPPQRKNPLLCLRVLRNLVKAHKRAYQIAKTQAPHIQVGVAAQLAEMRPVKNNILNMLTVRLREYGWNWWFLDRIKNQQDFIGLNFYFTEYITWRGAIKNPFKPVSDLGWYMEPAGISPLLQKLSHRYHKPIIITENGLADAEDAQRTWWLQQTMEALEGALASGVDLRGYLHWSLLDNFEWAYGWWPQFGLIHVDRTTLKRTIRPSAHWYATYIKNNLRSD